MKCPCKDCDHRTLTCHGLCEGYKAWRNWKDEVNRKRQLDGELKALQGVDADVRRGEVMVVIGPSGSGKSTFLRCLNLLKTSDRTVQQLTGRLRLDGYPEEVIRCALDYVASFHYTDDRRYAQNYVRMMSARKSRRQIETELIQKGVDHEVVRAALCEADAEAGEDGGLERTAILALARKRGYDPGKADRDETARFYRYLMGKGFGYESIRSVLSTGSRQDPAEYLD